MDRNLERTKKFRTLADDNGYKFKDDVIATAHRKKIILICPNEHEYAPILKTLKGVKIDVVDDVTNVAIMRLLMNALLKRK